MMNGESVKDMTSKFDKLVKFEGWDFRRWQKKMHFLLTTLKVVYVLSTPSLVWSENETLEMTRKRMKWENDDYICRGHILNEDASATKFHVSSFMNYKMVDTRPVMEQYNEMLRIMGQYTQHNLMMDEAISVAVIIDKLPPSWKEFKHGLKHKKEELNLVHLEMEPKIPTTIRTKESSKVVMINLPTRRDDEVAWWVDSGATSHVCKDLHNVLYVPGIRKNLISEIVLNKCGYKQVLEMTSISCQDMVYLLDLVIHSNSLSKSELWHARLGHVHYKRMRDMSKMSLIPTFDMTHENCKTCMLTKITRQPFKGVNRESKVLDLIHSDLCDFHANPSLGHNKDGEYYDLVYFQSTGIIHQTMAPYTPQQNGVAERKNKTLKEMVNSMLSYSGLSKIAEDEVEGTDGVPGPSVLRKSTRTRKTKSFGSDFQLYLVEGTRDKTLSQREYCFIIEEDPKTLSEAMASRYVAFWKEAVQSKIDSIMHNDTWELTDLPLGCKALGCKWILKRKMKVDGNIDKYKARLVIQSFRQKERIDFFDTYAPVARISTIRLLLALAAIHDLVIHQMDVKIAFLNGDLDEKIYMKQPEVFVMPGHESKVCKLKKSLYGLKQALKQWHQKFDDVVLSNGFSLNQADKCVYIKFDASGKGVIICLYVDDMLIFGTDQDQVNKTKEFLSSKFDMKDLGEAEVILGIRIKRGNNDHTVKFRYNKGTPVSQLEYSRAIGCLICDSVATLAKAYSQVYNGTSRHLVLINRYYVREALRSKKKDYAKTKDDLKSLKSVRQGSGEVPRPQGNKPCKEAPRSKKKDCAKTKDDLKSLQSVGQSTGEVPRPQGNNKKQLCSGGAETQGGEETERGKEASVKCSNADFRKD
uniref:Zinc finger, CCHC-type n=1 Tax=Tanacetum cinerariifolium TaxID=118510 RepID=A0A6L2KY72_TANCI|nr:zinc finger, CCHC-type [Tanacetum cinerariifolium]